MIENLRSLAILAAVVKAGSFRGAGKELGLSPSVISHHIANLEKRLDCQIFHRSFRKLELTAKGTILFNAARDMVGIVGDGLQAISEPNGLPVGTLRIAAHTSLPKQALADLLDGFMAAHPKINLELEFSDADAEILSASADFAFTREASNSADTSCRHLLNLPVELVAAPDLAQKINALPLTDVPENIALLVAPGFTAQDWQNAFSDCLGSEVLPLQFRLECNDLSISHRLARSGFGLAALPQCRVEEDLLSGRLVSVLTS